LTDILAFIIARGFDIADYCGTSYYKKYNYNDWLRVAEQRVADEGGIHLLYRNPKKIQRKKLFGRLLDLFRSDEPRQDMFGGIWFRWTTLGGSWTFEANKSHWVFKVYGRCYLEMAKQLVEELNREFGVEIKVLLPSENPIKEAYPSDWSY
jgi:hypothetical protein